MTELDHLDIVDHLLSGGKTWQTDFWQRPLSIEEFCTSPEHLGNVRLSQRQLKTLKEFLGDDPVLIFDRKSTRPNICVLCWGKGCSLSSSLVTLYDGSVKAISELLDLPDDAELLLPSYDTETRQLVPAKASKPFWRGKGECVTVRTASGREITVFTEHLFLQAPRENWKRNRPAQVPISWTPVKELTVGDRIALPAKILVQGQLHEPDISRWIGYVIGDGSATAPTTTPRIKCENIFEVQEDIRRMIARITGQWPNEWPDRNCTWFGSAFEKWETRRGENPLYEAAKQYGLLGVGSHDKRIPERCFQFDEFSTWQLLSGLWMTDGWVSPVAKSKSLGTNSWEVGYCSVSERLVRDIAELLHRFGIVARIGRKRMTYDGKPYLAWTIKVRERAMVLEFFRRIHLVGPKGARVSQALAELEGLPTSGKGVHTTVRDNLYWDEIVEIVPAGEHDYYDLEVEDTECYVAEGLLHHNSGKNMTTTILQQYMLYLLLCMRDPLAYFGFPHGESIDMLNVASSAAQAQKNFFNKFTRRIKTWRWLKTHYAIVQHGRPLASPESNRGTIRITDDSVQWDGGVQCISAHSDSKGYEGYSPVFWVMDEASSWDTEYVTGENGEQIAISRAHSIFDTLRTSSVSRSWKWAGLIISYPRNEDDFTLGMAQAIQRGDIKDAMADIAATWEVKPPHMWVNQETFVHKVIRPWGTFEIHPPKDFEEEFRLHPTQSELKYACVPSRTNTYFIHQNTKIHECQADVSPIIELRPITFNVPLGDGEMNKNLSYIGYSIEKWVLDVDNDPFAGNYYVHIDLSVNSDATTLAIGHAEPFEAQIMVQSDEGEELTPLTHRVVIDQIIEWIPDQAHLVSTINVDDLLEQLDDKLRFRYVSIDQYESARVLEKMAKKGREAGKHNVRNPEYLLLRSLIHANAITYPKNPKLVEELEKLVWNGKRVDHLPHYSKDRADAIAGVARSIFLKRGKRRQRIKFAF